MSILKHHVVIEGCQSASDELAAFNALLMIGLLSDAPVRITSRFEPLEGELTVKRYDRPIGSRDLHQDVAHARSWRQAGAAWASHFPVDVFGWISYILERQDEGSGLTDKHDRFERSASTIERAGLGHVPALDVMVASLREFITNAATERGIRVERQSPWPAGKKFALALSHDVDDAQDVSRLGALGKLGAAGHAALSGRMAIARRRLHDARGLFSSRGTSPYWLMTGIRDIEVAHGIVSTYFVLSHTSRRVREGDHWVRRYDVRNRHVRQLLHSLRESGAELALHTTYDAAARVTGVSEDLEVLRGAVPAGTPIRGVRNHYLRYLRAHSVQAVQLAGLEWDSSLGWANGWGFRAGTTMPFRVGEPSLPTVWQLGLELMDVAVPMRDFLPAMTELIQVTAEHGGVANVLVHPSPYDNATAEQHLAFYQEVVTVIDARSDCWVATGSAIVEAMDQYADRVAPGAR